MLNMKHIFDVDESVTAKVNHFLDDTFIKKGYHLYEIAHYPNPEDKSLYFVAVENDNKNDYSIQ